MKKIVSLLLALALCVGLGVPVLAAGFSDVPTGHYAAGAIDTCVAKGIASGYSDGSFKPGNPLTRTQFCVMLSRAFYPSGVAENDNVALRGLGWFVPNTRTLFMADVLEGTSFCLGYNQPAQMDQPISRYDMAQLMANIMLAGGKAVSAAERAGAQAQIADWANIPEKYQDAVSTCYALGILSGLSDGTFGGGSTMNRGQGCVVIDRMSRYVQPDTLPTKVRQWPPASAQMQTPATQPGTPAEAPAAGTLTNGRPITEENVLALLYELYKEYPGSTEPGTKAYIPVGQSISTNVYAPFFGGGSVNARECAGWAALVSDYIFGKDAPVRVHTDYYNCKPGDILYLLPEGRGHKSVVIDAIYMEDGEGGQTLMYLTTDSGSSHMVDWGWDGEPGSIGNMMGSPDLYKDFEMDMRVITRYPDDSPSQIVKNAPPPLHASPNAPAGSKASRDHSALHMYE